MLVNIAIAALLMFLTTAIHLGGMVIAMKISHGINKHQHEHLLWIGAVVVVLFFASLLEVIVWGFTYLAVNAIDGVEQAFYFSMVTFTTLGYGDVLLDERWRLLGSFEAVNGIIMFGWTTAIVIAVVQRVYKADKSGQ